MRTSELIGKNVREARELAGLSQRELGERIGWVLGKAWFPQAVSAAERGARDWAAEDLVAVAYALKRPVAWFFKVPTGTNPWNVLDVPGSPALHLAWVSGEAIAERTAEELTDEILRLTRELQAKVSPEPIDQSGRVFEPTVSTGEEE